VAGCCKCGDEPSGSCATELVISNYLRFIIIIGSTALYGPSFYQLKYPAIACSDFATRVFSRVTLSAPRPTPGYPGGPMLSVRVVSLS
jgi:hypothetical protein